MKHQKHILVLVPSIPGHINPTIKLSNTLGNLGYKITYLCDKRLSNKSFLERFEVKHLSLNLFFSYSFLYKNESFLSNYWEDMLLWLSGKTLRRVSEQLEELDKKLEEIKPDYLFIDVFFSYIYLLLQNKNYEVVFLQTMFSTYYGENIPPINSSIVPRPTKLSTMKIDAVWKFRQVISQLKGLIKNNVGMGPEKIINKLCKKRGIVLKEFENKYRKSLHLGLKGPELVLAPSEIDWPRNQPLPFQTYFGPSIQLSRKEKESDTVFMSKWAQILKEKRLNPSIKIIYCSLGSISAVHISAKKISRFFQNLFEVLSEEKDWRLIVSTGKIDKHPVKKTSSNIHVFNWIPQLQVLKHADLFITHGGMNSLIEGILHKVPLLCFPLNRRWDQSGNASRVVFHRIGVRGNIHSINAPKLKSSIHEALSNTRIPGALSDLCKKLESNYTESILISKLENILT